MNERIRPPGYQYFNILKDYLKDDLTKIFNGELVYPRQLEIHLPGDHKRACNFHCYYCFSAGTLILMSNLTWKLIEDIRKGDSVVGLKNNGEKFKRKKFVPSKVTNIMERITEVVKMSTTEVNVECTLDHRWLRSDGKYSGTMKRWSRPIKWVTLPILTPKETEDYRRGWIYGMANGDGCLSNTYRCRKRNGHTYKEHVYTFRLTLKDKEALDRFEEYLPQLHFKKEFRKFLSYGKVRRYKSIGIYKHREVKVIDNIMNDFRCTKEFSRGFLAGIFDAEGSYSAGNLRISNQNRDLLEQIVYAFRKLGFNPKAENFKSCITPTIKIGKQAEVLRFFALTNPSIERKRNAFFGKSLKGNAKIIGVEPKGKKIVYNIETETGNYIANGLVSKNCQGRLLKQPVNPYEDNALKIIEGLKGQIPYFIYGGAYSEPLLNPRLLDFLVETKKYGTNFGIHTNGSLLKQLEKKKSFLSRLCQLAVSPNDYLSVSLDAGRPSSHMKSKNLKVNWFDEIIEGIRIAAQIRGKDNKPSLRVCYLLNKFNDSADEINQIIQIMQDIGVDSLRFSIPYDLYGKDFDIVRQYKKNVETVGDMKYIKLLTPLVSKDLSEKPYIFYLPPICQDVDRMNFKQCIYSYYQITLAADGNMYRCSSVASPSYKICSFGKIPDNLDEFNQMIMANHNPDWKPSDCFKVGARCNRMSVEINSFYGEMSNESLSKKSKI